MHHMSKVEKTSWQITLHRLWNLRKSCSTPRPSSVQEFASFPKLANSPLLLNFLECLRYCCSHTNNKFILLEQITCQKPDLKSVSQMQKVLFEAQTLPSCSSFADRFCSTTHTRTTYKCVRTTTYIMNIHPNKP
jgi:hypothetical protein